MILNALDRPPPKKMPLRRKARTAPRGVPVPLPMKMPAGLPFPMFPFGTWPVLPVVRPLPTAAELKMRLDALASRLGATRNAITVEVTHDTSVTATRRTRP